jgi:spoIIIJ-associated protein
MENTQSEAPAPQALSQPLDPRQVLQKLLDGLGLQTKVEEMTMDGAKFLHIATVEPGRLIGKHGQTLGHLQFLLNRILQRADKNAPHITIDCERYRERQHDEILKDVSEAADRVRRWGDPVRIGPYGAFDRRLIHQYIERDAELEIVSEDEELGGRKKMILRVRQTPSG